MTTKDPFAAIAFDPFASIAQSPSTPPALPTSDIGTIRKPTTRERFEMTYPVGEKGESAGENFRNIGQNAGLGVAQVLKMLADFSPTNPRVGANAESAIRGISQTNPLASLYQSLNTRPGETASQLAGQAVAGEALGGMVPAIGRGMGTTYREVESFLDPLRAYRSPLIPQSEAIARRSTDILRPNPSDIRGTIRAAQETTPDIVAESGGKVANPLEYSKRAFAAGDRLTKFYQDNFITPNSSAPAGSSTVGKVYSRLSDINDELRPIYRSRTMGEQMTREVQSRMVELERERDLLNNVLYDTLSKRTGIPREKVQEINQRGAMLKTLADNAESAQNLRRMGYGGYTSEGVPIPLKGLHYANELLKYLRGGPESVAGRQLSRVLRRSEGAPTELPSPSTIQDNLRQFVEQQEAKSGANRARAAERKPEGLSPTNPPQARVAEPGGEMEAFAQRRARQADLQKARELERQKKAEELAINQEAWRRWKGGK